MKSAALGRPFRVLIIEDNPDDVDLTQEALQEAKILVDFYVAEDGVEGLDFLYCRGNYVNAPRPDLVLLDLNLPKVSGQEILRTIKADRRLASIPVVVLTTSGAHEDITRAYQHHANAYVTKPVDLEQFLKVVQLIDEFWLTVVQLPFGETDDAG